MNLIKRTSVLRPSDKKYSLLFLYKYLLTVIVSIDSLEL